MKNTATERSVASDMVKLAEWLLLAGYILIAHGCHGDEDNELFARLRNWFAGATLSQEPRPSVSGQGEGDTVQPPAP